MRKLYYFILLSLFFLLQFTTCKNPEIDYSMFSLIEESVQPGMHSVAVSGEYDFLGEVMDIKLLIGLDEQLIDAESYSVNMEGRSFYMLIDNLTPNTTFHYRYDVIFDNNHKLLTDIGVFKTLSDKPKVRTLDVVAVDITSYIVKSLVEDDFGMGITERGVCWGLTNNPTVNDNHVVHPINGVGEYTCSITDIEMGTIYYVRAYAKNGMGLSYADEVLRFETGAFEKPIVLTLPINTNNYTQTSAVCRGRIENEGSSPVIERGVLWGTTPHPENDGAFAFSASIENEFDVILTTLLPSTTYYFCAFARNDVGMGYGSVVEFTTLDLNKFRIEVSCMPEVGGQVYGGGEFEEGEVCELSAIANAYYEFENWIDHNGNLVSTENPYIFNVTDNRQLVACFKELPPQVPEGGIDALFSVSSSLKVFFSKGNLQYKAYPFGIWQFAANQWESIGTSNSNVSPNYGGWIDLYGWGTGDNPTNIGSSVGFHEWGDNAISNGGNTAMIWRTLTKQEWDYVFNIRQASTINGFTDARYVKAVVNNVQGVILFPDEYEHPNGIAKPNSINVASANFNNNSYSASQWLLMEANGCVFLPISGKRLGVTVQDFDAGFYWSSSDSNSSSNMAFGVYFNESNLNTNYSCGKSMGISVRLVYPIR